MVSCKNCIHYEVCDYRDPARYATIQDLKKDCRHCIPTADVVPKSEVEELKKIYKKYNKAIRHERVEVAREIFEEIEEFDRRPIPESKAVYVIKESEIAELKKKYTGGEK